MAMPCFGRAFLTALAFDTRPLDLRALRARDLAAVLCPDHFFFTAGCAAGRDVTFLAMVASRFCFDGRRLTRIAFRRVGKAKCAPPSRARFMLAWWAPRSLSSGAHSRDPVALPTLRHLNQCSL